MTIMYVIVIKNLFSTHLTLEKDTNTILKRDF